MCWNHSEWSTATMRWREQGLDAEQRLRGRQRGRAAEPADHEWAEPLAHRGRNHVITERGFAANSLTARANVRSRAFSGLAGRAGCRSASSL